MDPFEVKSPLWSKISHFGTGIERCLPWVSLMHATLKDDFAVVVEENGSWLEFIAGTASKVWVCFKIDQHESGSSTGSLGCFGLLVDICTNNVHTHFGCLSCCVYLGTAKEDGKLCCVIIKIYLGTILMCMFFRLAANNLLLLCVCLALMMILIKIVPSS